jgi:hypothetical protein
MSTANWKNGSHQGNQPLAALGALSAVELDESPVVLGQVGADRRWLGPVPAEDDREAAALHGVVHVAGAIWRADPDGSGPRAGGGRHGVHFLADGGGHGERRGNAPAGLLDAPQGLAGP